MRILRTASGVASRYGSSAPLRLVAAIASAAATAWLAAQLWGWAAGSADGVCFPHFVALLTGTAYVIGSLMTMAAASEPPDRWTLEVMTGYAPFMIWRAMISDGRVTCWKLLLWPLLVPAEALVCLWLAAGWLARLLDADLSER